MLAKLLKETLRQFSVLQEQGHLCWVVGIQEQSGVDNVPVDQARPASMLYLKTKAAAAYPFSLLPDVTDTLPAL